MLAILDLAFAWLAMLWFDTTIFTLTLVQAVRMRRYFPGGIPEMPPRDGASFHGSCAYPIVLIVDHSGTAYYG